MTVFGGLLVDGSEKVEFLDDIAGAEVEVLLHDADEVLIGKTVLYGAVGFDMNGEGVGETDRVGDLDEDSMR